MNLVAKQFLKELESNPAWGEVIKELKRTPQLKYKKEGEEESKIHRWIYESGRSDENDKILSILTNGELHE